MEPIKLSEAIFREKKALEADPEDWNALGCKWAFESTINGEVIHPHTQALADMKMTYNDFDDGTGGYYRCPGCQGGAAIRRPVDEIEHRDGCVILEARAIVNDG